MFDDDVLMEAGQSLFASKYADAYEHSGQNFGAGQEITEATPDQPEEKLLPIMRSFVEELEKAWGKSDPEVLTEVGVPEEEWGSFLYSIGMSAMGHGIGPDDELDDLGIENKTDYDLSPIYEDFDRLGDLAWEVIDEELRNEILRTEEDEDWPIARNTKVHIEARMPPGDTVVGDGVLMAYRSGSTEAIVYTEDDKAGAYAGHLVVDAKEISPLED